MIEEWKTIEGYEDYQVSNLGRVKSLKYKTEKILTTRQKNVEHSQNKIVNQYDTSGNYIQSFESAKLAGETTGVDPSAISKVCLGKRKTAGGFIWKYSSKGHADDQYNKICDKLAQEASKTIEITN